MRARPEITSENNRKKARTHWTLPFCFVQKGLTQAPPSCRYAWLSWLAMALWRAPETRCQHSRMSWPGKVTSGSWVLRLAYFLNSWFKKFCPSCPKAPKVSAPTA